jgi:phosphoribosyl 1,2-cyclic phosphodiesterase
MKITFWGTRGSIAAPGPDTLIYGGNTTCLEVTTASGRTIVIDAGSGVRQLGDSMLAKGEPLDIYLFMTHIHWDHVMGFPFFRPIFHPNTRITVAGSTRGIEGLRHVFNNKYMDGTWPISFKDLKADIQHVDHPTQGPVEIDGMAISSNRLHHPQGGVGFRFTEESGAFVFLTDNELMDKGWAGASFKDFVRFSRDADLLVHDCQYVPEEMELRRGWGHSDVATVARLALEANVKQLLLFHHDPWRKDNQVTAMVERCREIFDKAGTDTVVDGAREGSTMCV